MINTSKLVLKGIRRSGQLVLRALERAYDTHLEVAQMRLAPVKPRSWRDIRRLGTSHNCY